MPEEGLSPGQGGLGVGSMVYDDRFLALFEPPEVEDGGGLDEIARSAVEAVCKVLGADGAAIGTVEGNYVTFRAWRGIPDDFARSWRLPKGESLTGLVLRTGRPYASSDISRDPRYTGKALQQGVSALLVVPLRVGQKHLGCLYVGYGSPHRFTTQEKGVARAIADQVAKSIENILLLERERRERQRAETLLRVVSAATSSLSLKKVLIQICSAVTRLTVGDRCTILLYDKVTDTLEPFMSLGLEDPAMWNQFRASVKVPATSMPGLRDALRRQQRILIGHAPRSKLLPPPMVETFKIKTMAIYPMVAREEVVGAMVVDSVRDYVRFPLEELETLSAVATQAAVIIENARWYEQIQQQAITDSLTGLYNHRHLQDRLEGEIKRAERGGHSLAVLMLDIDCLKLINDTHGHRAGDDALKLVASALVGACRATDIVGRYGGDEFLAILPETTAVEAERVALRVQEEIAKGGLRAEDGGAPIPLHISIGVASYPQDGRSIHDLVDRADGALYTSKQQGGGRVTSARSAEEELLPTDRAGAAAIQALMCVITQKAPSLRVREHTVEVVRYSLALADVVGLPTDEREALRKAAWLHDVGKVAVPNSIVLKPKPLTLREWKVMRQHAALGQAILQDIPPLADAAPLVALHHEAFDGRGYPRGLRGEEIPPAARILALADAYSSLRRDRPYRRGLTAREAAQELRRSAGGQFDPQLVQALLSLLELEARAAA